MVDHVGDLLRVGLVPALLAQLLPRGGLKRVMIFPAMFRSSSSPLSRLLRVDESKLVPYPPGATALTAMLKGVYSRSIDSVSPSAAYLEAQ